MRLESLHLHGFKSFADRTILDFRDGVTAIVGSNGCGKSNIADAIRWVLGEQRASAIRGSKMDEVIFQGTARRRALNYAEVSLLFDNEKGRIPIPQTQLEISRKVFREGGSEYFINRASCRLKDVHGLLRDTGLGANAYSIIETAMIDLILSDRADERRTLFEEAAGIGKYKDSRQSASRRLEAADADLRRLDDVIAEVEAKVRSLSRQKRRAEKHGELQRSRLNLEVAIASREVEALDESLRAKSTRRSAIEAEEHAAGAERSAVEMRLETGRVEAAELARKRAEAASRLDGVRSAIDERERTILVSRERSGNAEQRETRLLEEARSLEDRVRRLDEVIHEVSGEVDLLRSTVVEEGARLERKGEENRGIRSALVTAREGAQTASDQARSLAREIATSEGRRGAAERRGQEARERGTQLKQDLQRLRTELDAMSDQTDLWVTEADELRNQLDTIAAAHRSAGVEVESLKGKEQRAREEVRVADDRVSTLSAQVAARESVESGYDGFSPVVSAVMSASNRFPGVRGPLANTLEVSESDDRARAVEAYLGPLIQAIVIDDFATARSLRRWFYDEWKEGGTLLLLPLEALALIQEKGGARPGGWEELLLSNVAHVEEDPLSEFRSGIVRVGSAGEVVDAQGIVRLVAARDEQGILSRRAALARLRRSLSRATADRDARYREREGLRSALSAAEVTMGETEATRRRAEARLRALELDAVAHRDRRKRLQEERERTEGLIAGLEASRSEADTALETLGAELVELSQAVAAVNAREAEARQSLSELERMWDLAREEESDLRVRLAGKVGAQKETERRLAAAHGEHASALGRLTSIARERQELKEELSSLSSGSVAIVAEIEGFFAARDNAAGEVARFDGRLAEVDSELSESGERARIARRRESELAEERHRLDLEIADARSKLERIRERLEAEWGRPWSALSAEASPPAEGNIDRWRTELRKTSDELQAFGPVNMLAVEEHAEEQQRLDFLLAQRSDLVAARDNLLAAIREINKTACEVFESTFEAVRVNFRRTFHSLFQGGECDLWLTDPSDPLESPVEIQASPQGKKTQRIHLLSGGERALTALALLFALYLVKPSPFCVLDEVDAPLDETNVGRFVQLLQDFKQETQFIVITHHPRTMEAADWVYGVTMEDPGVSSIVGVELLGAWTDGESKRVDAASV